jgi:hypothetical protein
MKRGERKYMYLYIGSRENATFCEDVIKERKKEVHFITDSHDITTQIVDIISYQNCSHMIFDIEQYLNDREVIVSEIKKIQNTNNAEVIIFAEGFSKKAEVIIQLYKAGITEFIFEAQLVKQKEEFIKCIEGYYKKNSIISEEEIEIIEERKNRSVLVGVTGSMSRIGTTTQAMQMIKCLSLKGKSAAYIQFNDSDFISNLKNFYQVQKENEDLGYIKFENVDMFYKKEKINEILQEGYDYYIYDYGGYQEKNFNKTSFLEKEIQIFVLGVKPTELTQTLDILSSKFYSATKMIFNYSNDMQKEDIKNLTKSNKNTYICDSYITDCFKFSMNPIYEKILGIRNLANVEKKKIIFSKLVGGKIWQLKKMLSSSLIRIRKKEKSRNF